MSKKYFRVNATMTTYLFIDVEADSAEEAEDIAENIDGGLFIEDGQGSWDIDEASEITADQIKNLVDNQSEE